ncbi:MAG: DUF4230 domain-containing protein [Pseudomonadota bacterium]
MASDLKPQDNAVQAEVLTPETPIATREDGGVLGTHGERLLFVLVAVLVALALFLGWRAYFYQEEGDPVASAMLAFEKQNSLVVFSSRFEVVAESEFEQTIATIPVRQVRQAAIIPASIDYRLDLSAMDASSFEWDEETQTLNVLLPQLQSSRPNLDESKARIFTEGLLNTGGSQQLLSESNSEVAERKAQAFAKNPEILSLSRSAAKDAVRQNLAIPLQVAGYEGARVEVRFAGE